MKKVIQKLVIGMTICALALCVGCSQTGMGSASKASSSASASSAALASNEKLVEVVLSGGSGRASVESPAKVTTAADGTMTLTVVWSSSSYDKMVVNGVEYLPVNTSGNSTFEIPVASLDADLPVQAETTAMSTPHMIDYVLSFATVAGEAGADSGPTTAQVGNFHNADLGNGWKSDRKSVV